MMTILYKHKPEEGEGLAFKWDQYHPHAVSLLDFLLKIQPEGGLDILKTPLGYPPPVYYEQFSTRMVDQLIYIGL